MLKMLRSRSRVRQSAFQAPATDFSNYRAIIDAFERGCTNVAKSISDAELMLIRENEQAYIDSLYFYGGRSALKVCVDALIQANAQLPNQILDFPCGHGRALRFFRAAFPQADIYASDLLEDGVEFCKTQFAAKGFRSHKDFSQVDFPTYNDLIWCGSLLTHVDDRRAKILIERLFQSLAPNGLLLFSIHGRAYTRHLNAISPMLKSYEWDTVVRDYHRTGYGYHIYAGHPELEKMDYGISLTSPNWIYENVIHCNDDRVLLFFAEKGWHGQQDVVAIQRKPLDKWYNVDFL